jgi:hypothetical protein
MFQTFKARALVEALGQQDQFETHPLAFGVLALGRMLPVPGRGAAAPKLG